MNISSSNEQEFMNQFADLLQVDDGNSNSVQPVRFGAEEINSDLLSSSLTNTTTLPLSTTDTTTLALSTTETTTVFGQVIDADLAASGEQDDPEKRGPGRPVKYDFSDMSGYAEARIKEGKFVKIEEETETGEKLLFVPKTPEEFDEFFQLQVDHKLEEAKKDLDTAWYSEKSPAFQVVAKYAETLDNPADIIPFLQGVQTIETVANINEKEIEGAEYIVKLNLAKSGQPQELIDTQVEALKTTNKLIETAEKIKPAMIKAEQMHLARMQQEEQQRISEYRNMVVDIRTNAVKAIETPFGKEKLRQEEKAAIYDLIAEPDAETRGYAIFNKIDELFEKKDFDKLRKVALLLSNEEAFTKYLTSGAVDKVADGIQRKLRVASESRSSGTDNDGGTGKTNTIQRSHYNSKPRFGR